MPRAHRMSTAFLLSLTAALLPAALPAADDVDPHRYIDRPTQPFPRRLSAPREDRPFLTECVTPMVLIGHLEMSRDRGGFYGAELREAPRFDGLPVEAPGYFRMLRAEEGIGNTRGHTGILGHRDPFLLRGHFIRRTYKADKEPWEAPRLEEDRVFTAGSMRRFPFLRVTARPRDFFRYLQGQDLRLKLILENPTDHPLPRVTLTMHAQPRNSSFPLERRMDLERGWDYEVTHALDAGRRRRSTVYLTIPGKQDPAIYKQAERVALGGPRWPYPPITAEHRVHEARARAGEDLARLQPERTLIVASGEIPRSCEETPLAVRYRREFRPFGVVLDGLDLEIMAGWSPRLASRFLRLLQSRPREVPDWIRPVVVAAMEAKLRRVPVVRRPGGIDEFDVIAMHLWGPVEDGSTHYSGELRGRFEAAWDALYRHDGKVLPVSHRESMRRHVQEARGRRMLRDYSRGEGSEPARIPVPQENHLLPEQIRENLDTTSGVGRWRGRRQPVRTREALGRTMAPVDRARLEDHDLERKRSFEATRPRRPSALEPTPEPPAPSPEAAAPPPDPSRPDPLYVDVPATEPTPTTAPTPTDDDLFDRRDGGDTAPPATEPPPAAEPPPDPFAEFGGRDEAAGEEAGDAGTDEPEDPFAVFGGGDDATTGDDAGDGGSTGDDLEDAFDDF